MSALLHPEHLLRIPIMGEYIHDQIAQRAAEVALAAQNLADPDISVLIRAKNNAGQLRQLLDDIRMQQFHGEVEVVVVDTESTDNTRQIAEGFGATIVPIKQEGFSYPKALNQGFAATNHRWVLSLVDHSQLVHDQTLRIATCSEVQPNVAGVSGIPLPNANASWAELIGTAVMLSNRVRKPAKVATKTGGLGLLATNASLIDKRVWSEVRGFDEHYGAGGEDGALAAAIMSAGYDIVINPAMAVHHTHGLGLVALTKQLRYWTTLNKPQPFDLDRLAQFRKEYRAPEA